MKSFFFSLLIVVSPCLFVSCDKEKKYEPTPEPPVTLKRTVLVYIVGDNGWGDLSTYLLENFDDMVLGIKDVNKTDCNLIVYSEVVNDVPHLIQISNTNDVVKVDTLFTYAERNPLNKAVMSEVITQTVSLFPAESYGFVFLSHSTSLLPASSPANRSVGVYRNTQMCVVDLKV